jgi:uncharacterized membrane protein YdjX (TVP38/TMEM64 family)
MEKVPEISWKVVVLLTILGVCGASAYMIPDASDKIYSLFKKIEKLDAWGYAIFIVIYAGCMILTIPVALATISLSILYDFFEANIICDVGTALGTLGSYFIGKTMLKEYCMDWLNFSETSKAMVEYLKESEWKFAFWVHMLTLPVAIKNYGLASMGIGFWPFNVVGIGMGVVFNAIYIFLGSKCCKIFEELKSGNVITWEMGVFMISIGTCVAGFTAISIMVQKSVLKEQKYETAAI